MPLPWRCSQRRTPSMQVEAIGGPIIFHMQPSTSQREVNAPIWKRRGLRRLGRSCWCRLVKVSQQGRYVPLSVVATPHVDSEVFQTQDNRLGRSEEPHCCQVEGEPLQAQQPRCRRFRAFGYLDPPHLQPA